MKTSNTWWLTFDHAGDDVPFAFPSEERAQKDLRANGHKRGFVVGPLVSPIDFPNAVGEEWWIAFQDPDDTLPFGFRSETAAHKEAAQSPYGRVLGPLIRTNTPHDPNEPQTLEEAKARIKELTTALLELETRIHEAIHGKSAS